MKRPTKPFQTILVKGAHYYALPFDTEFRPADHTKTGYHHIGKHVSDDPITYMPAFQIIYKQTPSSITITIQAKTIILEPSFSNDEAAISWFVRECAEPGVLIRKTSNSYTVEPPVDNLVVHLKDGKEVSPQDHPNQTTYRIDLHPNALTCNLQW